MKNIRRRLNSLGRNEDVLVVSESNSTDYIESEGRMNKTSHNPVKRLIKLWK